MSRVRITRRTALAGIAAAALSGCQSGAGGARNAASGYIDALVASGAVPAAGLVVRRRGWMVLSHAAGLAQGAGGAAPAAPFTVATKIRVASVSKLVTALTAHRLAALGKVDLDADMAALFGRGFRHPAFPDDPITLRQLLGHTGGLEDPETYWIAAPGEIAQLFVPGMWRDAHFGPPGEGFRYANFGYVLIATALESAAGERFDTLAQRLVIAPLGLAAGFNWSGVPLRERRLGATLYRKETKGWRVEADGSEALGNDAPAILAAPGFDLATYRPGTNGTLFSPQGGLRASLLDLCAFAHAAASVPALTKALWRAQPGAANGDTEQGYFTAFSAGAHLHPADNSPFPGYELIGHHGEAYGLYCGAWRVPALDAEFAYAITGTPDGEPPRSGLHPATNIYTADLFKAAALALAP